MRYADKCGQQKVKQPAQPIRRDAMKGVNKPGQKASSYMNHLEDVNEDDAKNKAVKQHWGSIGIPRMETFGINWNSQNGVMQCPYIHVWL